MSFPAYGVYKESGIEWLGKVPSHWIAGPIRFFAQLQSGHTPSRQHPEYWENCTIPWFSLADVAQLRSGRIKYVYDTKETISELGLAHSSARLLPAGTVMLSRTASVGFSAIMGRDMATTQDFANWVCGPRLKPEFLLASLHAMSGEFRRLMMGSTHQTIYMPDIAKLAISLPPVQEQEAIVSFLDRETAKIDDLVAEQQRLIKLLQEKRQAVISHAVTKGLDPAAPMKDSGVEWLGEVPAHWDVCPLMRLTDEMRPIMYGIVLPGPNVDEGIPIVKGGDVKPHRLRLDLLNRTTPEIEAPYARARLQAGDIVYSIRGTIGDAELVPDELEGANITQDAARIAPDKSVLNRWLLHTVRSRPVFVQLEQRSLGAAVRGINIFELKRARIPVPPPAEQQRIADYLDQELAAFDALRAAAEDAIALLQERRAALISAAVTGKIDVRENERVELAVA
ncbi:restriction endonuclease subunit S [Rhodopseudomonas palustris]|uniref:restriction endonuclease subunit S n=1 Tax=Rhodopseudomonas palustris TaxID=1076 RepID=UPI0021F39173|nr:restriction endonuclease subunit S [Rhodopseudomonas palustris]UYO54621.1 restriction endonuclease subunit S [Rhodopseudomonas palustris]